MQDDSKTPDNNPIIDGAATATQVEESINYKERMAKKLEARGQQQYQRQEQQQQG